MSDLSQESPLWREWAESRHSVQQMREELDRLRAELAVAQKDAERYRWLRDEWYLNKQEQRCLDECLSINPWADPPADDFDAAIDAAMRGGNG